MQTVMVGCKRHTCKLIAVMACLMAIQEVSAQRLLSRAALDSLVNPPVMKGGNELLVFQNYSIDIGNINEGDAPYVVTYKFRNMADKAICITGINTSCSCTQVQYPQHEIKIGKEDSLQLVFNPMNQTGRIDAYAYIYTDLSDTHPITKLSIKGFVSSTDDWRHLPHKIGALRLKRKEITFREVKKGLQPSLRIVCANTGEAPLRLSADKLPEYIGFRTEPDVIEVGQEADVVITLYPDKLPEQLKRRCSSEIIIQGVDASITERIIKVNIKSE